MKVLLVEDERDLAEAVAAVLHKNNFSVDIALDGEYGLDCALSGIYDAVVLDIMLPKMDGFAVLEAMRLEKITSPVIMLTARSGLRDRVRGLDLGADDYLPKPFHTDELMARLRALARRPAQLLIGGTLRVGGAEFSPHALKLSRDGRETPLTLKESGLLELLCARRGGYVSKDLVIEKLWSFDADVQDGHVESQVSLLRKKLALAGAKAHIKTARGVGYRLEEEDV